MIRFFLLQNRQGKTRFPGWDVPPPTRNAASASTTANGLSLSANPAIHTTNNETEAEKARIESEVHRLVTSRDKKYTNFIKYNNYELIYRRYAGMFFTIAVDVQDNELSFWNQYISLWSYWIRPFANMCKLGVVFNFSKVYMILDEFMLAGEIEETSKKEILDRVKSWRS